MGPRNKLFLLLKEISPLTQNLVFLGRSSGGKRNKFGRIVLWVKGRGLVIYIYKALCVCVCVSLCVSPLHFCLSPGGQTFFTHRRGVGGQTFFTYRGGQTLDTRFQGHTGPLKF